MSAQPVDPAANASLFILQDNIHQPMHDRFLWTIRQHRDHQAMAIPEWEELRELASKIKEHTLTHLVVLLDPEQVVADTHDAYARVRLDQTAYGCFMMGPSATGDIEATLVHGAQGSRSLNLFFLGEGL
jgi:LUD domain